MTRCRQPPAGSWTARCNSPPRARVRVPPRGISCAPRWRPRPRRPRPMFTPHLVRVATPPVPIRSAKRRRARREDTPVSLTRPQVPSAHITFHPHSSALTPTARGGLVSRALVHRRIRAPRSTGHRGPGNRYDTLSRRVLPETPLVPGAHIANWGHLSLIIIARRWLHLHSR